MPGLRFGPAEPFSFEVLIERARAHGRPALCAAADAGARGGQADRLRRARQAALPAGIRAVRRRPGRLPGHLPVPRRLLPQVGEDARGRRRPGARDHLLARLFHGRPRTARRASCRPTPTASPASGSRRAACRATGPSASPGPPSWAPPTSGRWASWVRSGMSARGLALERRPAARPRSSRTSSPTGSRRPPARDDPVVVHSLLDGPSVCGAYRFMIYRDHRRGHGHREPPVPAPGRRAPGHRPADLDVLVRRVRPREDRRLAARGARFRRARDLERRRRAHLAPAQQPDPDLPHQLSRQQTPRASA